MADTVMMRLSRENHAQLAELAAANRISLIEEMRRLIDAAWRQHILDSTNRHYAELRADPHAWSEEEAERAVWETTLMDGLSDEPPHAHDARA